jgi:hypothetical protein
MPNLSRADIDLSTFINAPIVIGPNLLRHKPTAGTENTSVTSLPTAATSVYLAVGV